MRVSSLFELLLGRLFGLLGSRVHGSLFLSSRVPGFDTALRDRLIRILSEAGTFFLDHAVYIQTMGPRFETPAEVWALSVCIGTFFLIIVCVCVCV